MAWLTILPMVGTIGLLILHTSLGLAPVVPHDVPKTKININLSSAGSQKDIQEMTDPFLSLPRVEPYDCLKRTFRSGWIGSKATSYTVCINDPTFNELAWILRFPLTDWEPWLSSHVIEAMETYPDAVFVDIGAHIGVHALAAASLDREVVAVDAVYYNLALISHSAKWNPGKVRIMYNSVSDEPGVELYPYMDDVHTENGWTVGTHLVTKESLEAGENKWDHVVAPPVVSVSLQMLLDEVTAPTVILKVDIEGYECKALNNDVIRGKSGKYIPYIFIEWEHIKLNRNGMCPEFQDLKQNLLSSGYIPLAPLTLQLIEPALPDEDWPFDVIWKHKTAKSLEPYVTPLNTFTLYDPKPQIRGFANIAILGLGLLLLGIKLDLYTVLADPRPAVRALAGPLVLLVGSLLLGSRLNWFTLDPRPQIRFWGEVCLLAVLCIILADKVVEHRGIKKADMKNKKK